MKMKFDTGCTVCVMSYSLGDRRLFASQYTIEINIAVKDTCKDSDEWWMWLYDMFGNIAATLEDSIFISKKYADFEIKHNEKFVNPTTQIVYEDGFSFTIPTDWIVESHTSIATHVDVANWIKKKIENYIEFHHDIKTNQLPGECDITIVVWDSGEYAHTELEFTPKYCEDNQK